jgi:hypothetical protein
MQQRSGGGLSARGAGWAGDNKPCSNKYILIAEAMVREYWLFGAPHHHLLSINSILNSYIGALKIKC